MEPVLLILTSFVKTSNSVIFAIQVTLEDADDNEHNKYGKSILFPQPF